MALQEGTTDVSYGGGEGNFKGLKGMYAVKVESFEYTENETDACVGRYKIVAEIIDSELEEHEGAIGVKVFGGINNPKNEKKDEDWAKNCESQVADWAANVVNGDGRTLCDEIREAHPDANSWFTGGIPDLLAIRLPGSKVVTYLGEQKGQDGDAVFPKLSSTLKPWSADVFAVSEDAGADDADDTDSAWSEDGDGAGE